MPPSKPIEITESVVIVGEGAGDAAFLRHLCAVRTIGPLQVLDAGGTGKLEAFLRNLPSYTGFRKCKLLIVMGDGDDTPDQNFRDIRTFLKRSSLPTPDNAQAIARQTTTDVHTSVLMIPFGPDGRGVRGCLETLLMQAAFPHNEAIANCIPAFGACVGIDTWTSGSHKDKFKLRTLLAASFPDDPNFGLQYALDPKHDVIPLNHSCFDSLAAFLQAKILEYV